MLPLLNDELDGTLPGCAASGFLLRLSLKPLLALLSCCVVDAETPLQIADTTC